MTISVAEFQQLKKMMELTFSEHDGEALNALRIANRMLKKHNLTWRGVLERTVTVDVEPAPPAHGVRESDGQKMEKTARDRAVDDAFKIIRHYGKWNNFVGSLYDQWEAKGYLSESQRAALFRNQEQAEGK